MMDLMNGFQFHLKKRKKTFCIQFHFNWFSINHLVGKNMKNLNRRKKFLKISDRCDGFKTLADGEIKSSYP